MKTDLHRWRAQSNIFKGLSLISLIALISLIVSPLFAPASAQEIIRSVTVIPPSIEQQLDPGSKAEGVLKIINDSETSLTFRVNIRDFIVNDTIGTPEILPPDVLSNKYSAASWIGVTPNIFTVQPHTRQIMNYYIQIPPSARPGGHYAAVTYEVVDPIGVPGTGTAVESQTGTLFYIHVKGPIKESSLVTRFAPTKWLYEYGPATVNTQIKNMGDLHVKPRGYITVYNMFGKQSYILPLDQHNIFPERARDFTNTFGKSFMIGRYTAKLLASYGQNNNLPLEATLSFWVIPWKALLLLILLVTAAILGIKYMKKKNEEDLRNTHQPPTPPQTA